jgi:hypothetical protein
MVVFIVAQPSEIIIPTSITQIQSNSVLTSYNGLIVCRYSGALLLQGSIMFWLPVPLAARSKAWVCVRSPDGIVGSSPTGGMNVCLL